MSSPTSKPRRDAVLAALAAQERRLHSPAPGTSLRSLRATIAAEFVEVGASGRQYHREQVLDVLERRLAAPSAGAWEASELRAVELARGLYLLTYALQEAGRSTRRSSLWQRAGSRWKILFHQGTLVTNPEAPKVRATRGPRRGNPRSTRG